MNPGSANDALFAAIEALDPVAAAQALAAGASVRVPQNHLFLGRTPVATPLVALWDALARRGEDFAEAHPGNRLLKLLVTRGSGRGLGITGQPLLSEALLRVPRSWSAPVIRCLLTAGATADTADADGVGPLHRAAERGDVSAVTTLLAAGGRPGGGDRSGRTPLMAALAAGHGEAVRTLLAAGADPNEPDNDGATALVQQTQALVETARSGQSWRVLWESIELLLGAGADPNRCPRSGAPPLVVAAGLLDAGVLDRFLKAGADPNGSGCDGITALMALVSAAPRPEAVSVAAWPRAVGRCSLVLRKAGAAADRRNAHGVTADEAVQRRGSARLTDAWLDAAAQATVYGHPRLEEPGRDPREPTDSAGLISPDRLLNPFPMGSS